MTPEETAQCDAIAAVLNIPAYQALVRAIATRVYLEHGDAYDNENLEICRDVDAALMAADAPDCTEEIHGFMQRFEQILGHNLERRRQCIPDT